MLVAAPPPTSEPHAEVADRPEEIQALEDLLSKMDKNAVDRPRTLRRLADLHQQLALSLTSSNPPSLTSAPSKTDLAIQAAHERAAELYTTLKNDHPNYCHRGADSKKPGCLDETLYLLAFEDEVLGRKVEARAAYLELLKKMPLSRFVPNVYLALGDRAFDAGQMQDAIAFYEKVVAIPVAENPVAAYAHYKLGFTKCNAGDMANGLSEIRKAIEVSEQVGGPGVTLAKVARKDLVSLCDTLKQQGTALPPACNNPP
jgi:tetratricopeptide (TPR) repeat protein